MGRNRKILVSLLCVLAVCTGCGEIAPGADIAVSEEELADMHGADFAPAVQLDMQDALAARESSVEIPLEVVQNRGFAGIGLEIIYDSEALRFEGIRLEGAFRGFQGVSECTEVPKSNIVRASYAFVQDIDETGEFAVLRFHVKENAKADTAFVNVGIRDLTRLDDDTVLTGNEKSIQIHIEE